MAKHNSAHPVWYEPLSVDPSSDARRGRLHTPHGVVELPAFMPVGTQGTVKGVDVGRLRETGAQMVLGNTYHLAQRPGEAIVAELGGLHAFSGWDGPMLTDSGGFQVFSLSHRVKVTEQSAKFPSQVDGSIIDLSPEHSVDIQQQLGADVAMVLDHVPPLPSPRDVIAETMQRSIRWAKRCQEHAAENEAMAARQSLFAIVQGGLEADLRRESAEALVAMDFAGYAIGGLSVGESQGEMLAAIEATAPYLPADRPRYLMGVGTPSDLLESIARGVDMFDCVLPTRNGRNALAYTPDGTVRLRNSRYRRDPRPLDATCLCPACERSLGYLAHLFRAKEMLGPILVSIHNLTYFQRLMAAAREAIEQGQYAQFKDEQVAAWERGAAE